MGGTEAAGLSRRHPSVVLETAGVQRHAVEGWRHEVVAEHAVSARALGERSRGRSPPKGHAKASLESSVLAQAPKRVPALDKASRCDDPWGLAPSTD